MSLWAQRICHANDELKSAYPEEFEHASISQRRPTGVPPHKEGFEGVADDIRQLLGGPTAALRAPTTRSDTAAGAPVDLCVSCR